MSENPTSARCCELQPVFASCLIVVSALAFGASYGIPGMGTLSLLWPLGLICCGDLGSARKTFYWALAIGSAVTAFHLFFFWTLFGGAAIVLWLILGFWLALFAVLAKFAWDRCPKGLALILIPAIWTGLEYFRSELYYLRFSWLNVGYAVASEPRLRPALGICGVYGVGFIAALLGSSIRSLLSRKRTGWWGILIVLTMGVLSLALAAQPHESSTLKVVGVQLEFPLDAQVLPALNGALANNADADLFVLSEYTFSDVVPEQVKAWCRKNQKYLVLGAKDPAPNEQFFNTAFVIDPKGMIEFRQAKTVPIQFFKDGLPAPSQALWNSPWGKIGLCICYDLSYTHLVDRLVRMGAQALIVPTMDVAEWGAAQHRLHAFVAPARASEYGLGIFRLASSGISQLVDPKGYVLETAPFPGDGVLIVGNLAIMPRGRVPWDRWLAPACTVVTGAFILWLCFCRWRPWQVAKQRV